MPKDILTTAETIENLYTYWHDSLLPLQWNCLFLLPPWLKAWQSAFAKDIHSEILVSRSRNNIIGIVPLLYKGNKAMVIGSENVCDYSDLIINPNHNKLFLHSLFDYLRSKNIKELHINGVTEDNSLYTLFPEIAAKSGYKYFHQQEDVSYIKKLPADWQKYLDQLSGKQRHEVRRKIRRLEETGKIELRIIEKLEGENSAIDTFLQLFTANRKDKAEFMDKQMSSFFKELMHTMSAAGLLRLYILFIENIRAATALCFDYNKTMYLYNSGYNPQFSSISAGVFCKAMSIKNAIDRGCTTYDFLKGSEPYKHRLGGVLTPVYQLRLHFG